MAYMMMHPGKKLTFMGTELAQMEEWNTDGELPWEVLSYPRNKKLHDFIKSLNKFYNENPAMYETEDSWEGFHWIHHDDFTQCVLAFRRLGKDGNGIIAVCNFLPVKRENYSIGVPYKGVYTEVFNTDDVEFGGNGISNVSDILSEDVPMHGYEQSIVLTIPPLSVMYFKCKLRKTDNDKDSIALEDEETIEELKELSEKIAQLEETENSETEEAEETEKEELSVNEEDVSSGTVENNG